MIDYLNIGPTPAEEECAQVGIDPNYDSASQRECAVYRRMLERLFPIPEGCCAYFAIQSFPHDFGFYREVCVQYNPENADECEFAYRVEAQSPAQWDAIARSELDWYEQCARYRAQVEAGELTADQVPAVFRLALPPEPSPAAIEASLVPPMGILRRRLQQQA